MQGATEQADVPLAAFLAAATAILVTRRPGDLRALVAAGAFASLAAWTKNEGLLVLLQAWGLHLLALVAWIAFCRKRSSPPPHLRWLSWVPAAVMVVHAGILLGQPHDLGFMFKVTIDRLFIQVWPMTLLLIACRFSPDPGRPSLEEGGSLPAFAQPAG